MKHLTAADRGKIETLLQEQYTSKQIVMRLGRFPSSISEGLRTDVRGSSMFCSKGVAEKAEKTVIRDFEDFDPSKEVRKIN